MLLPCLCNIEGPDTNLISFLKIIGYDLCQYHLSTICDLREVVSYFEKWHVIFNALNAQVLPSNLSNSFIAINMKVDGSFL